VWTPAVESALNYDTVHTVNFEGVATQPLKVSEGEDTWLHTLLNAALGGGG